MKDRYIDGLVKEQLIDRQTDPFRPVIPKTHYISSVYPEVFKAKFNNISRFIVGTGRDAHFKFLHKLAEAGILAKTFDLVITCGKGGDQSAGSVMHPTTSLLYGGTGAPAYHPACAIKYNPLWKNKLTPNFTGSETFIGVKGAWKPLNEVKRFITKDFRFGLNGPFVVAPSDISMTVVTSNQSSSAFDITEDVSSNHANIFGTHDGTNRGCMFQMRADGRLIVKMGLYSWTTSASVLDTTAIFTAQQDSSGNVEVFKNNTSIFSYNVDNVANRQLPSGGPIALFSEGLSASNYRGNIAMAHMGLHLTPTERTILYQAIKEFLYTMNVPTSYLN